MLKLNYANSRNILMPDIGNIMITYLTRDKSYIKKKS